MGKAELYVVVPGDIDTNTGGYRYDRRIIAGLRQGGSNVELVSLTGDFPFPSVEALQQAEQRLAALPEGSTVVVDGLAFGAMPRLAERLGKRLKLVALVHHPLALETGLSDEQVMTLEVSEREALQQAQLVITTSPHTAASLAHYDVPRHIIHTVRPGTDPGPLATGSSDPTFKLLCVATLTRRKGHAVLIEALARLQDLDWRLSCVGSTERDAETFEALQRQVCALGLERRVTFHGEVSDTALSHHYQRADLFVLASYHEGFGMVLTEAIAHGLPLITTDAGAIAETVPAGAGLLVPAGAPEPLAATLRQFMEQRATREALSRAAREARKRLYTWDEAARDFQSVLNKA